MSKRLITPSELLQAPTGIDWGTVGESAVSGALQAIEQSKIIDRASDWIANYCTQRLDCTQDTEQAILGGAYTKCWVDRNGFLWYRTDFFPILSVVSFQWGIAGSGSAPSQMNSVNVNNIVTQGEYNRKNRLFDYSQDWTWLEYGPGLLQVTYINGYPNAVTTAVMPAAGNSRTIVVDSTLGMTATAGAIGNQLTIYDGALTETITVQSVTDATHFVAASIANDHTASGNGLGISCVPDDVKEACILTCMHFARQRGVEAFVMGGGSAGPEMQASDALPEAEFLLQPYKRIL